MVLDVLLRRIAWLGGYELWLVVYRCGAGRATAVTHAYNMTEAASTPSPLS